MANRFIEAATDQQIEAAVDRTLRLHARQSGVSLASLARSAVEEVFDFRVTTTEVAAEHDRSGPEVGLVADVLQRAERRLGEMPEAETGGYSSPACLMHELGSAFSDPAEPPGLPAPLPTPTAAQEQEELRLWRKAKREALIQRRLDMPAAERTARTEAITAALLHALPASPETLIGFYWPFKGEYDPRPLVRSLHAKGTRLALPVVVAKAKPLIFREWWPGMPMAPGIWKIPIPAAGKPVLPDVLLVPLVGFDRQGYRLGYGGGYYDRTLADLPRKPWAVGVGFELARIATIHPQLHDIPMNQIITERTTFSGGS